MNREEGRQAVYDLLVDRGCTPQEAGQGARWVDEFVNQRSEAARARWAEALEARLPWSEAYRAYSNALW